jgi:hypothetical protein
MRLGVALIAICATPTLAADAPNSLIGTWAGGDHASQSIYGTLTITESYVAWNPGNRFNNSCKANYKVVAESSGTTFPDQLDMFKNKAEKRGYRTYKLKLESLPCTNGVAYLQFSLPSDLPGYADVVEYDGQNRANGWIHFDRSSE